jgi:FkbM family methyltransferase
LIENPQTQNLGYDLPNIHGDGEDTVLEAYLKPGHVVFDVGANIGDWTTAAFAIQESIIIKAFEPIPQVCQLYTQNVKSQNAQIFPLALSEKKGSQTLYVYGPSYDLSGRSSLHHQPTLEHNGEQPTDKITVTKTTLDRFCREHKIRSIDYLKIDVEGHELSVIRGARGLLKAKKIKAVQFEYGYTFHGSEITLKQVYQYLSNRGFLIFRLVPEGLIFIPSWSDSLENWKFCNYVGFLPSALKKSWKAKIKPRNGGWAEAKSARF